MRLTRLYIDGHHVETATLADTRNPATGEIHGRYCEADPSHALPAWAAAGTASGSWGRLSSLERRGFIRNIAQAIRAQAEVIARLITEEVGKPLAEARGEVMVSADAFDWAAEESCRLGGVAMDGYVAAN